MRKERAGWLVARVGGANLVSAFGGGLVLNRAARVVSAPHLREGLGVEALLFGMLSSLLLVGWTRRANPFWRRGGAALGAAALSALLMAGIPAGSDGLVGLPAYLFAAALALRWGFFFSARALRADSARTRIAGNGGLGISIAWAEIFYFGGLAAGLLLLETQSLSTLLAIDIVSQLIAASLDATLKWAAVPLATEVQEFPKEVFVRVTAGVAVATVGVQAVVYSLGILAGALREDAVLAAINIGVAASLVLVLSAGVRFEWSSASSGQASSGWLKSNRLWKRPIRAHWLLALATTATAAAALIFSSRWHAALPVAVGFASLLQSIVTVPALDYIGRSARRANSPGRVAIAYAAMGFFSVLGIVVMIHVMIRRLDVPPAPTFIGASVACGFVASALLCPLRRRDLDRPTTGWDRVSEAEQCQSP